MVTPVPASPVTKACDADGGSAVCEWVLDATDGNETLARMADVAVGIVVILVAAVFAAWFVRRHLARLVERVVAPDRDGLTGRLDQIGVRAGRSEERRRDEELRRTARARSISRVVGTTSTSVIWVIAVLLVLGELGVSLGPLIAGAGLAGAALSFGAQSLIKDCIAGLFVLVEDQYGIGDVIDLGEATGTVEEITLRATVLRGVDGTVWHVPNGEVQRVGNHSQLWSVALVDVDVAYDSDLTRARTALLDAARDLCSSPEWSDQVLQQPDVLGVEMLGADGITLRLVARTTPGAQWGLQRALRERFKTALDEADVEIPFPQRTVWMRTRSG